MMQSTSCPVLSRKKKICGILPSVEKAVEEVGRNHKLLEGADAAKVVEKVAAAGKKLFEVQFGKTENQIYHAFRHTDALGLDRELVRSTIYKHFKRVSSQVITGKPFTQIIEVEGKRLQYTAFKLSSGIFNIGRIHGVE